MKVNINGNSFQGTALEILKDMQRVLQSEKEPKETTKDYLKSLKGQISRIAGLELYLIGNTLEEQATYLLDVMRENGLINSEEG